MSKEQVFSQGTIVEDEYLNSNQEVLTGLLTGFTLARPTSSTISATPTVEVDSVPNVRGQMVISNGASHMTAYEQTVVTSGAYAGGAGAVSIWAKTSAAIQSGDTGNFQVVVAAAHPGDFSRKIGEATADGANILTGIKMLTGVQADATQLNNFTFRSVLDAPGEVPLTLRGRNAQNTSLSKMLSVGHDIAGVYNEKWGVTSLGLVETKPASGSAVHYQAQATGEAQPRMQLTSSILLGGGAAVVDTTIARGAAGQVKITDTVDVIALRNSEAAGTAGVTGGVAGDLNVADNLNLQTGALYKIGGAQISSASLSDVATLATLTYVKEGYVKTTTFTTIGPHAVASTDHVMLVSYNGATQVNLPASPAAGKVYVVADSGGFCSATNTITVDCDGAELVAGLGNYVLMSPYESVSIVSLGVGLGWAVL